jgi:hypothetical protein
MTIWYYHDKTVDVHAKIILFFFGKGIVWIANHSFCLILYSAVTEGHRLEDAMQDQEKCKWQDALALVVSYLQDFSTFVELCLSRDICLPSACLESIKKLKNIPHGWYMQYVIFWPSMVCYITGMLEHSVRHLIAFAETAVQKNKRWL